ncbi:MAG: HAD family hydrolase [Myxococcales bacterium]|nr:MAG: HAD family hydrolase [Myxococcales bacterium]
MPIDLASRWHWIFDLDGTLTVPAHDFDEIRRMFGLPEGRGILESLDALPPARAEVLRAGLDEYEYELAAASVVAEGAAALLETLAGADVRTGIVTRNSLRNVECTLVAIGLADHFALDYVVTRDCPRSRPKPHPDGILYLLESWGADARSAVMVGNHVIDVEAGRAAGAATVLVAASDEPPTADLTVESLGDLVAMLTNGGGAVSARSTFR